MPLACVALVLRTGEHVDVMPHGDTPLQAGAQILFCGRDEALLALDGTLHNEYTLRYLITGVDEPRVWAMRWLTRALRSDAAA